MASGAKTSKRIRVFLLRSMITVKESASSDAGTKYMIASIPGAHQRSFEKLEIKWSTETLPESLVAHGDDGICLKQKQDQNQQMADEGDGTD
jgi:hypothetical protein